MTPLPFPLSNRAIDIRPGCKTQRIAPMFRQVADLVCTRTKETEYFQTCIVGHMNCCLQCGLSVSLTIACKPQHDTAQYNTVAKETSKP
ncbi:hypothetical protein PoB_006423700 [Plakobranchus ocellatus]|uniref:Uncharacterized protein n=1 Tax=Plakobranchus ocellatus TaxID=259542 RepID=A0AAV4D0K1_9GAST|nr:hypothetical protein PoB_006423700 [Plakobranchus ocellatus]